MQWNLDQLFRTPEYANAEHFNYRGDIQPVFYDCGTWRGRPIKSFAWIGFPKDCQDKKVPGMVLVHGGGGTAFPDWVKLWNDRGYAAIAMDTCGGVPCWNENPYCRDRWPGHRHSGPAGWGTFADSELPPEEQWPYQATASVIAAHSLLRSFSQVDADRIGITGVSWGGVLTCIAAGLDYRLAFAAPVYGCGFIKIADLWTSEEVVQNQALCDKWSSLWDPSLYLRNAGMPFLWVNGTNDFAFALNTTLKSAKTTKGKSSLALIVRMEHGHGGVSEKPEEIHNFANAITKHGEFRKPAEIASPRIDNGKIFSNFATDWQVASGEFNYTTDGGVEKERLWHTVPANVDDHLGVVSASAPVGATGMYFNLFSEAGVTFSSAPLFA